MKVKDFMTKGIVKCDINDEISTIAEIMETNNIGFIAVEDDDNIIGVITDRDIVIGPVMDNIDSIADFISTGIISIDEDKDIEEALSLMKKNKIKRLLVTRKDKYVGVISISDLLNSEHETTIFDTLKEIKN